METIIKNIKEAGYEVCASDAQLGYTGKGCMWMWRIDGLKLIYQNSQLAVSYYDEDGDPKRLKTVSFKK